MTPPNNQPPPNAGQETATPKHDRKDYLASIITLAIAGAQQGVGTMPSKDELQLWITQASEPLQAELTALTTERERLKAENETLRNEASRDEATILNLEEKIRQLTK